MTNESLDIDRIVREIVERLRAELTVQPVASLTLEAKVVTLAELRGKLGGIQKLVLKPRAIITPSVRDELREKNIEIVRNSTE